MNVTSAADCLSATGSVFPALGLMLAITLVIVGVSFVLVREKLARTSLIVIPILVLVGLTWGIAPSARAETSCGSSMPVPSESASPSPSPSPTPAGGAPTITNVVTTFTQDNPWTVTATGDGPIDFYVFTFSYMQFSATRLSLNPATGVMTPPINSTDRGAACDDTGFAGNTNAGVSFLVVAHNAVGQDSKMFTVNDNTWCNDVWPNQQPG